MRETAFREAVVESSGYGLRERREDFFWARILATTEGFSRRPKG
jgi:hypothetical protein